MKLASLKPHLLTLAICASALCAHSALVDTDGNAVTNETALGDIDMAASTYGDLKTGIAPNYSNVSNAAVSALAALPSKASTNDVVLKERGFSAWTLTGPDASIFGDAWTIERVEGDSGYVWKIESNTGLYSYADNTTSEDATELIFTEESVLQQSIQVTATRTALSGYRLGPDDAANPNRNKPLQPAGDYATSSDFNALSLALASKQDKLPYATNAVPWAVIANKPTIPAAQVNSDWNASSGVAQILNKPTNVSAFNNDAEYATSNAVSEVAVAATNYANSAASAAVVTANSYTDSSTNAVVQHVDAMDTSYFRFETITNVNQSVQYVATDANTTELRILMPSTGMTKDWLVYVYPATNLNIVLPGPADYWCSSYDVTNAIPAGVPTALYFSQITEGVFSLGRKKLDCPITISSPLTAKLRQAQAAARRNTLNARRATLTATAAKSPAKPTATAVKPAATNATTTATKK